MTCAHPPDQVTADILQGDFSGHAVQWCRCCGAFRVRTFDPDYIPGGKRDYTSPWNAPSSLKLITTEAVNTTPYYYQLFQHMADEHGLILTNSEMDEISRIALAVKFKTPVQELENSYPVVCYFPDAKDREEFIEAVKQAKPNMTAINL